MIKDERRILLLHCTHTSAHQHTNPCKYIKAVNGVTHIGAIECEWLSRVFISQNCHPPHNNMIIIVNKNYCLIERIYDDELSKILLKRQEFHERFKEVLTIHHKMPLCLFWKFH